MRLLSRAVSALVVLGAALGLLATPALTTRSRVLSSLVVPPPRGYHSSPIDDVIGVRTGAVTVKQALRDGCNGKDGRVLSQVPRPDWLGTELRFYANADAIDETGTFRICVTRFSSTAEARLVEALFAAPYRANNLGPHVVRVTVPGVAHATAAAWNLGTEALAMQVTFSKGSFVVCIEGEGRAATLVPALARHQYARLP